ncbi:MAG: glycosyltransferase [Anaerolineales bacterium]|nr:glycosyltransferase [Anaerolineales bacterium]
MRVLHLINDLSAGGAQSGLFYLLKNSRCFPAFTGEVCVIHCAGEFGEKLREAGVHIHEFGFRNRYAPSIAFRLYRLIKNGGYHIVHVHLFPGLYWGACLAWMFPGCRWVYTEHSMWNKRRGLPWAKRLEEWAYRQYDRIIAISESAAQSLLAWQPWLKQRISIIPNGIDLSEFEIPEEKANQKRVELGVENATKVILYAGRLVKEKGADVLLQTAALLDGSNWRVFLAGDGAEMTNLNNLCQQLGLDGKVIFLGKRSDIPELMAASDVVVLPSRWEGLPLTLLEAMAAKKPVVACQVGGVAEVLRDGKEGFLVPPENPEAMAEAISKILLDPDLAQSMAETGRQRAEYYSAADVANQLYSLYVKLL